MSDERCEVLVVGAGPTGLTAAVELARRGIDVRVVEAATAFGVGTRARGLSARSMEVMDDIGIAGRLIEVGSTDPFTIRMYDRRGRYNDITVHGDREPSSDLPYPRGILCSTSRIEAALRDQLKLHGVTVELDSAARDLVQHEDEVQVTVESAAGDQRQIRASYVIGADGGRSVIRKQLGLKFEAIDGTQFQEHEAVKGRVSVVADLLVEGLPRDEVNHMWPGGVAISPNPKADTYWFTAGLTPGPDGTVEPPTLESCERLFHERTGLTQVKFVGSPWMSTYRFNVRMVDHYRSGRVFVAGDAAHIHIPAGGQGMNTGIQDAYNLGWKLAAVVRGADERLLDTYEAERHPVAAKVLRDSTRRGAALFLQAVLMQVAGRIKPLGRMFWRWWGKNRQLDVAYRSSALSREVGPAPGKGSLRAGDRVPGPFDLLRGPHWTVFGLGARTAGLLDELGKLPGVQAHVLESTPHGPSDGMLLVVRPDGYLGLRCPADAAVVTDYLHDKLGQTETMDA
ncbi:FAD-dependent monooxygenase [Flindersiella endophytica]